MGFNSAILILNDAISVIDADPVGWWKKTRGEILNYTNDQEYYGYGSYANYFKVICNHHMSTMTVVAIGGNDALTLHRSHEVLHEDQEALKLRVLKEMADQMGFSIRKKPTKQISRKRSKVNHVKT